MNTKSKSDVLNAYAQKLMDIGIEIISGARIKVGEKWARDPKVIALTILSRTLGNMKGAVIMARERLLVETMVLTRCCYENLICIGALSQKDDVFVDELMGANAASKQKQAKFVFEKLSDHLHTNNAGERLEAAVKALKEQYPKAKPINTRDAAESSAVANSYLGFSVLSEAAVHVSVTSLGRHLAREVEDDNHYLRVDIAPEPKSDDLSAVLSELCGVVLGICVGTNEIVGGTPAGQHLRSMMDEFDVIKIK